MRVLVAHACMFAMLLLISLTIFYAPDVFLEYNKPGTVCVITQIKLLLEHNDITRSSPEQRLINKQYLCTYMYRMGGNFRGVLIFVDFMGPTQTTKIFSKNHCTSMKITFWEDLKLQIYLCSMSSPALFRGTRGGTIPTTVRVSGVLRDFNRAMLKYVLLLRDLPAPVTVQEETVPAAEL